MAGLPDKALLNLFSDLKSAEQVSAALASEAGKKWLLTPLSKDVEHNALSYMADGLFDTFWRTSHREAMTAALAAYEKLEPDAEKRVSMLTATNGLGQSVILKSLEYGGHRKAFEPVLDALYKWAGEEKADKIMKAIITEPLGQIDSDISYMMQDVRRLFPHPSKEFSAVDSITTDSYHPVTMAGLRDRLAEIRPHIAAWLEQEKPDSDYSRKEKQKMQAFYDAADPVTYRGTLLTEYFPGNAFFRLLEIQLKGADATPQQKADDIFALLSVKNAQGNTPMHRKWVVSDLLSTPTSAKQFTDFLSPALAAFDRQLGTDVALELTKKLLLQENEKGQLPLDIFQYPKLPTRDLIIDKLLQSLRDELGSKKKFTTYVTEVIAPVLPADYKIDMAAFEPKPQPKPGAKPARGATFGPK